MHKFPPIQGRGEREETQEGENGMQDNSKFTIALCFFSQVGGASFSFLVSGSCSLTAFGLWSYGLEYYSV